MMKNKNMKHILILITLVVFLSCQEETPTDNSDDQIQTEYTLEELESDPDWVEVTDIDTTKKIKCIWREVTEFGRAIRDLNELKSLYNESYEKYGDYPNPCYDADSLEIDFNKRTLFLYWESTHPIAISRKIFKNEKSKMVVYLICDNLLVGDLVNVTYGESVTIPKVSKDFRIVFARDIVEE